MNIRAGTPFKLNGVPARSVLWTCSGVLLRAGAARHAAAEAAVAMTAVAAHTGATEAAALGAHALKVAVLWEAAAKAASIALSDTWI